MVATPIAICPITLKRNINEIKTNTIKCPPSILANRRTIKAMGFVKIPNSSIRGNSGIGHFNPIGTSGQNISFHYSFVPETLITIKVHKAKTIVMDMLPVTFAPPGNTEINPTMLEINIKKKSVSK